MPPNGPVAGALGVEEFAWPTFPNSPDGLAVLITRPRTNSPVFARSRQWRPAVFVGAKWGDVLAVRDGAGAERLDLRDDGVRRRRVGALAAERRAKVVDDDARARLRERAAQTAPGGRVNRELAVEQPHQTR